MNWQLYIPVYSCVTAIAVNNSKYTVNFQGGNVCNLVKVVYCM